MSVIGRHAGAPPPVPAVGTTALDTFRNRIGTVMGHEGPYLQLRPLGGGREWDADVGNVQLLSSSELLSARVAEANARSCNDLGLGGLPMPPQTDRTEDRAR